MTGLIYVAIIAVWAVVLVPAWLRRHDHLDPERSVDRFTRSMQTLAARPSVLGIPMPTHEEEEADPSESTQAQVVRPRRVGRRGRGRGRWLGKKQAPETGRRGRGSAVRAGTRRRRSAAARRRIVLGVLLLMLAVVSGLVAAGVLLPVSVAAPCILIVGFLALARYQVRAARRARVHRTQPRASNAARPTAATRPSATTPATSGSTWEARATPLPSYVTAPPATGYPRVIDQVPGAWTAAAMLERAQKQKDRAERMAAAKAEAIARARAEQEASLLPSRDEEFLATHVVLPAQHDTVALPRVRAVNE